MTVSHFAPDGLGRSLCGLLNIQPAGKVTCQRCLVALPAYEAPQPPHEGLRERAVSAFQAAQDRNYRWGGGR